MNKGDLRLITGNAHPALAQSIASELKTRLIGAHVGHFPDGETSVKIDDNVRDKDVFLVQPTGPPSNQNIMESLIIIDALKRASAGRITAIMPYFGYARQDRKESSRVPISAKLVANLFGAAGADRLLSVDLHSGQLQGFTDLPFDHLYARYAIAERLAIEVDKPVIVAPDVGASKMARSFASLLGSNDWSIVDKTRIDGKTTEVAAVIGHNVAGRNVVLVDDIVTTVSTLLKAAEILKKKGAKKVFAAVTHGVMGDEALERIESSKALDRLYVTDSLPQSGKTTKLSHITIAPLLAQAIFNIHKGKSVSELFSKNRI